MNTEQRLKRVELLAASISVNLATVVDRLNGNDEVPIESLMNAMRADLKITNEILGIK